MTELDDDDDEVFAASIGSRFVAFSPNFFLVPLEDQRSQRRKMMNGPVESRSRPSRVVSFGIGTFLSALQLISLPRNGLAERRINFVSAFSILFPKRFFLLVYVSENNKLVEATFLKKKAGKWV